MRVGTVIATAMCWNGLNGLRVGRVGQVGKNWCVVELRWRIVMGSVVMQQTTTKMMPPVRGLIELVRILLVLVLEQALALVLAPGPALALVLVPVACDPKRRCGSYPWSHAIVGEWTIVVVVAVVVVIVAAAAVVVVVVVVVVAASVVNLY